VSNFKAPATLWRLLAAFDEDEKKVIKIFFFSAFSFQKIFVSALWESVHSHRLTRAGVSSLSKKKTLVFFYSIHTNFLSRSLNTRVKEATRSSSSRENEEKRECEREASHRFCFLIKRTHTHRERERERAEKEIKIF